jgi:uncharacterized Tic20 family protein
MDFEAYGLVLAIHSTLRWVVLGAGLLAAAAAWASRFGSKSWTDTTAGAGRAFAVAMDLQLVVGLLLYVVLSPTVAGRLGDLSGAMGDAQHRFWMVEHPAAMIVALVLAHIGVAKSRRAVRAGDGPGPSAWYFTLAFLLVVAVLPWPFLEYGRPLLPSW